MHILGAITPNTNKAFLTFYFRIYYIIASLQATRKTHDKGRLPLCFFGFLRKKSDLCNVTNIRNLCVCVCVCVCVCLRACLCAYACRHDMYVFTYTHIHVPCDVKYGTQHTGKTIVAERLRKILLTIFGLRKEEIKRELTNINHDKLVHLIKYY